MTSFPRLIEFAFPLKQASLDSVHEKNEGLPGLPGRIEERRAEAQAGGLRCFRPFGLRGKGSPGRASRFLSPLEISKIPYGGFSPVAASALSCVK
jgi:hypothetical protein